MITEEITYFLFEDKPGRASVFYNSEGKEVGRGGKVPAGANTITLKEYEGAVEAYEAAIREPSKEDAATIQTTIANDETKQTGLQTFADEALALGFSADAIEALTGKTPKKSDNGK